MEAKRKLPPDPAAEQQLLELAQRGNSAAEEALIHKYASLVRFCARPYFLTGGDSEDLIQEGMLGLLSAIRHYDPSRGAAFRTFAELCVRRRIFSAIKRYSALETIDLPVETESGEAEGSNPEEVLIDRERREEFLNGFLKQLSKLERQILSYYLQGKTYREISSGIGKSAKSVDNAIQRIRRKSALIKFGETG